MGSFSGKIGLVMGVANDRSIAWAMSEALYEAGAELLGQRGSIVTISYFGGEKAVPGYNVTGL